MKTRKVTRHYCDHCGKGMFKKDSMLRHESMCFRNKNRWCPDCENDESHKVDWDSKGLKVSAVGAECPTCLLALVVLHNDACAKPDYDDPHGDYITYPEYKVEVKEFRDEKFKCGHINHETLP